MSCYYYILDSDLRPDDLDPVFELSRLPPKSQQFNTMVDDQQTDCGKNFYFKF